MQANLTKVRFLLLALASLLLVPVARAEKYGLGVILGEPTGFNFNYELGRLRAADIQFGFSSSVLHLNLTYQYHVKRAFNLDGAVVDWYYGIGAHYYSRDYKKLISIIKTMAPSVGSTSLPAASSLKSVSSAVEEATIPNKNVSIIRYNFRMFALCGVTYRVV